MEQELSQSHHASILEPAARAQQSFSWSHENSVQVNTSPRRARMTEDDVATGHPRLGMCAMISVSCEREVPEIDWEKLVKARLESEVKRILEFGLSAKNWQVARESGTVLGWTHRRSQEWRDQHQQKIKSEVHASSKMCLRVSARL